MASIASRSSWGARHSNGDRNLSGLATAVFLHHTVTTHLSPNASVSQERAQMRSIESIGQQRFGTGISYNVIVFPSGRAYQGVSFNRRGTHTGGRNSTVRSICFAGNYEANQPTRAQLETAAAIYQEGRGKWWTSSAPVNGHRDVSATSCPGKYIYAKRGQIRSGNITGGAPGGTGGGGSSSTYTVVGADEALGLYDKDGSGRTRIADWQTEALGYVGKKADGYFGPDTERDTKKLQRQLGVKDDGLVGDDTMAAWEKAGKPKLKKSGGSKPSKPSAPKGKGANLTEDGKWGKATTRAVQRILGTPVDGVVSFQPSAYRSQNPGLLSGWDWTDTPRSSNVIEALQKRLGVSADGRIGPQTIRALQRKLGTPVDGRVSNPSVMVKQLQRNLNAGKLW